MPSPTRLRTRLFIVAAVALVGAGVTVIVLSARTAASAGCSVAYVVSSQVQGGFGANVTVTNLGEPVDGWTLTWSYTAGQRVMQARDAMLTQSGDKVTAQHLRDNAAIATNANVSFDFDGSWTESNPEPASFALNGTVCTGGVNSTTGPATGEASTFEWSSSDVLISPKPDAKHAVEGIKDPSVVYYNGRYHLFASVASSSGYGLVYLNFTNWSQAASATHHYLDPGPIGSSYRAAPQVFYFAPQRLWYLVYHNGNAAYSTNRDISDPDGWTAPRTFYSAMPDIIQQNIGDGYWEDMWVICDSTTCYLFSSDDNGHLYRSQTSLEDFPKGMTKTVIAMRDAQPYNLYESSNVYKLQDTDQYLLLVEAIGSDGNRYFRSWKSDSIAGTWKALAADEGNPFARVDNVTFSGTAWTRDISHGEMIRAGNDQTLTISACDMRYVYQGKDPAAENEYDSLPWRLGLLTQTNSTC